MRVIVGLGNPGIKYENTFHNCGFDAIDLAAEFFEVKFNKKQCHAAIAEVRSGGEKVLLVKPQTYMNLSGVSVRELISFYKLDIRDVLVIYDDYDLPMGSVRIREKGSSGTHNGMRSIVGEIGGEDFPRVRIGIKPQTEVMPIIDYVLSERRSADKKLMQQPLENAAKAAVMFANGESLDAICRTCNINLKAKAVEGEQP